MLEIRKIAIAFDERDLLELQRIIIDSDKDESLIFLRKSVYEKILHAQQGKLKSYLDGEDNPVAQFKGEK